MVIKVPCRKKKVWCGKISTLEDTRITFQSIPFLPLKERERLHWHWLRSSLCEICLQQPFIQWSIVQPYWRRPPRLQPCTAAVPVHNGSRPGLTTGHAPCHMAFRRSSKQAPFFNRYSPAQGVPWYGTRMRVWDFALVFVLIIVYSWMLNGHFGWFPYSSWISISPCYTQISRPCVMFKNGTPAAFEDDISEMLKVLSGWWYVHVWQLIHVKDCLPLQIHTL